MALTDRQRKIVNPYAETVDTDSRRGLGYDYENESNKFVIDAIHESYLFFYEFPKIGKELVDRDRTITIDDMLAYFALYPQNGKVANNSAEEISDTDSIAALQSVVEQLRQNGSLEKYSSNTSELTYKEEYRNDNDRPDLNQDIANLIAVPSAHSKQYKNQLRNALGLPDIQYSDNAGIDLLNLSPSVTTYISSDSNVDLYDWRKNGLPGEDNDRVYYNPVDLKFYYVKRTGRTEPAAYAFNFLRAEPVTSARISFFARLSESQRGRYNDAVETSIREILKLTGKNSEANFQNLLSKYGTPDTFALLSYRDLRPGSRWIYCLQIDSNDVNSLPDSTEANNRPSYEEYELSTLQKAKRIIGDQNKSTRSVTFQVEDMLRYMFPVRGVLGEYNEKLLDDGFTPQVLNGIDLAREVDRLESFFDLLSLFYGYNKISLEDDDFVQMFFTKDYLLDHICINGSFYYQGTGNTTYLNINEEQARIANAFSLLTPTSFSFLKNSYEIYTEVQNTTPTTREPALDFLSKYSYPPSRIDAIRAKRANNTREQNERLRLKRKNLFTKLSELSRVDPSEYERLFSNRPLSYRMSSTLSSIDCNTGQAKAAKYALRFWQAATGKTKIRSLIRETIILLRQEVIEDETTKARISDAARYADNPTRTIQEIERAVNQQIFCSLDVLGDFIEDNFLDPIGAPPVVNSLIRETLDQPIKIEFKKRKMIGLKPKQSKVYQKAIEIILQNFIKSIIAGVAKDVVNALLGCGPEGNKSPASGLRNSFKKQDFGFTDLRNFVEEVDLVEIARLANLFNIDNEGQTSPATLEQLQNLLEDVSEMSTPVELQQLLDGDADNELISHIFETVSSNHVVNYISPFSNPGTSDLLTMDPNDYNSLNFSNNKIIDFFVLLGDAIENQGRFGDLPFRSPLEAYCDQRESYTNPLELNFDIPEIEAQYTDIVSDKINKINNLCNWLRDLANIKFQIERLIDSLPTMTWYDDLLEFIASVSNSIAESIAELFSDLFGKEQKRLQNYDYNVYNSKLGTEIYYQLGTKLREGSINQLYRSSNGDVFFMTPAGHGQRTRITVEVDDDGDVTLTGGEIGSRRNGWTSDVVYNYIWMTYALPGEFPKLPLPQYRSPVTHPFDIYGTAYYSIVNAPSPLKKILNDAQSQGTALLSPNSLRQVYQPLDDDGDPSTREKTQLNKISNATYGYLKQQESFSPYVGYAGASNLYCSNPPKGDIRIVYWDADRQTPTVAYYNPAGLIHNERSVSSNTQTITENGDFQSVDYRIFNNLQIGDFTYRVDNNYKLFINDTLLPPLYSGGMFELYSNFSVGLPFENPTNEQLALRALDRDVDLTSMQNYRERIDTQIDTAVINDTGRRRMPRYVSAVAKLPLERTDDICVTAEDILRAESAIQVIQTRMISFFMNVMPLARVYPCWNSVGTVKLITDYLYKKITDELTAKEMIGPLYESIQYVKLVFPQDLEDSKFKNNPAISDDLSPSANVRNIIESMYVGILENISKTSEYKSVNRSVFDPESPANIRQRYENTLVKFYRLLFNVDFARYGIEDEAQARAAQSIIGQFYNGNQITQKGMLAGAYYFPIAFQIASYMIYYDRGIKYANRYSDTQYRILLQNANADDNLLTALKGELVTKFSAPFAGFPATVSYYDGVREVVYYSSDQVEERLRTLTEEISDSLLTDDRILRLRDLLFLTSVNSTVKFSPDEPSVPATLLDIFPDYFSPGSLVGDDIDMGREDGFEPIPQDLAARISEELLTAVREKLTILNNLFYNPTTDEENEDEPGRNYTARELYNVERGNREELAQTVFRIELLLAQEIQGRTGLGRNGIDTIFPSDRMPSLYFDELANIFETFNLKEYNQYVLLRRQQAGEDVTDIEIDYVGAAPDPDSDSYVEKVVKSLSERFFRIYLPNLYRNYNVSLQGRLEEKSILETLINRNE
jgi:hypothetical protein